MVTKAKRVGLWAAAIFAAGHVSGCAFAWLAAARADESVTFECKTAGQTFGYDLPDDSPETLARLAIVTKGASGASCGTDASSRMTWAPGVATAGHVVLTCPAPCPDGRNVTLTVVLR